jgi:hypothetical protein
VYSKNTVSFSIFVGFLVCQGFFENKQQWPENLSPFCFGTTKKGRFPIHPKCSGITLASSEEKMD